MKKYSLITGSYGKIKEECAKMFSDGYFEFNFLYVPETERFREIDRFLYESRHTLRFENEYVGDVVIDLSEWNEKPLNTYFEAFMYFIKDKREKYNCAFIISERCSDELQKKLGEFFGKLKKMQLSASSQPKKLQIGFVADM